MDLSDIMRTYYSYTLLILVLGIIGLYGTNSFPLSGAQMSKSNNMTSCVSDSINQSNYLTNHCTNTLIKTNDTITNLDLPLAVDGMWIVHGYNMIVCPIALLHSWGLRLAWMEANLLVRH